MRNITLLRDQLLALSPPSSVNASLSPAIVCIAHDKSSSQFFALTQTGSIYCCSEVDDGYRVIRILYVSQHTDKSILSNSCYRWFDVSYLAGTGVLACLSYNGDIVSFELDGPTIMDGVGDQVGVIDGGIAAAAWSPDRECLVLLTNNSSILCMSSSWEVLYEVALPADMATDEGTVADVSWKGDGEHFALISVDKGDNQAKLRIYNKHLELSVTARNVVEGPGSVMKGIGRVVAFSSSGNYVSVFQERIRGRLQVALVEPNGLRHGDFDLQLPLVPLGCDKWTETSIAWDLTSSIVAIGLVAVQSRIGEGCGGSSGDLAVVPIGLVQFYTRSNYHWYLKQQWIAEGLRFLRFDEESVGRCYMSMASPTATDPGRMSCPVLRLIDFTWDTCYSASSNGTVAVVDGSKLLLTPLGWCTVPPPLSKHVVSIASTGPVDRLQTLSGPCCRCTCFWTPTMESGDAVDTVSWGLAALTDDSSSVVLVIGDGSGAPITRYSLDLAAAVGIRRRVMLRSMVAAQSDKHLIIALVGSELMHVAASSPSPGSSERLLLLKLLLHDSGPEICSVAEVTGFRGLITCICPVPADPTSIVLGVMDHSRNEFEIFRADCSSAFSVHTQDVERALVFGADVSVELVAVVPELCSHIAFISNHLKGGSNSYHRDQSDEPVQYAAVALSSKNRLYFGDSYLAEGVSSFAYNPSFQMLLYTTLGMKPHLHFCSLEGLQSFEPHQNDDRGGGFECAAPRPIERGSKIVIAVHGSSKVVLQLPRGNLECIEPRPLILLKAQHLLTSNQLFQCFVLLRKQRVDLNFLVDFDPMLFLSGVETMINAMLADNPDSISLFVTALEPVDTTLTKYPLRDKARVAVVDELVARGFQGDGKVNSVCRSVRNVLLPILHAARVQDGASSPLLLQCTRIIQPILCTYARQRPPAIVEALQLIRSCSSPSSSHVPELSAPLAQVSIKYLTFLADGSSLFDAALGECDFLMSRAVARLCQMDPKSYLPLIERFESIGTTESESPQEAAMHFRVNVHLKRWVKAVDWAVETLRRFLALRIGPAPDCCWDEDAFEVCFRLVRDVMQDFELLLRENGLFAQAVPRVVGLDCRLPTPIDNHIDGDVQTQLYHRRDLFYRALVNGLRLQFGWHCWAQKDYSGALSLFMSTQPMHALEAIEAARILGHWRLALTIADKYRLDDRYAKDDRLNPQRIAREIVNEFRENLDQGGSFIGSYTAGAEASPSLSSADRILAVAHLCEEYCRDPEGAISILTAGHRWMQALRLAFRYNRDDLSSEVAAALRDAAKEYMLDLSQLGGRVKSSVKALQELWENPEQRLNTVAAADPSLLRGEESHAVDDSQSVYSAATEQSTFSDRSTTSRSSTRSRSSAVSVLSNLSALSKDSQQQHTDADNESKSHFQIAGLEHTLLSRGTLLNDEGGFLGGRSSGKRRGEKAFKREQQAERKQKRMERSRSRGLGKDASGLLAETSLCEELLQVVQGLKALTASSTDMCEALLLLNECEDVHLASQLQSSTDRYMNLIQNSPAPVAPSYPKEWLTLRNMSAVLYYQDASNSPSAAAVSIALNETVGICDRQDAMRALNRAISGVDTWWDLAADGIKHWRRAVRRGLECESI